jgi:hypothetical protein
METGNVNFCSLIIKSSRPVKFFFVVQPAVREKNINSYQMLERISGGARIRAFPARYTRPSRPAYECKFYTKGARHFRGPVLSGSGFKRLLTFSPSWYTNGHVLPVPRRLP